MEGSPSSTRRRHTYIWKSSKKKEDEESEKARRKNTYYGDYGIEDNIYDQNGFLSAIEQERLLKEAMEEQERATNKVAKNKGILKFAMKRKGK
ncbi:hypothetical protein CASFOL_007406 [Castilleja foliolosa]|uniref:Uncharacterized protein n=1 Tax=Castilleja foliolosa TaxID=1961234 RepID=A0ABD3E9H6_9LAMI